MILDGAALLLMMFLAIFLTQAGIAFFVVGLAPGRSAPWWKQYGCSAACLTCAYYLFRLVFDAP